MSFEFFHLQNSEFGINTLYSYPIFRTLTPTFSPHGCSATYIFQVFITCNDVTCNDVLEREQLVGMIKKKDPKRLLMLLATASCVGSTLYPCSLPNCFAMMVFQNESSDSPDLSQSDGLF